MQGTLDLRRLRYFLAVAEKGSISGAARALNLAQPALSYHIAELERLTGHVLFRRGRDGVTLTEAGHMLERHCRDIVLRVEAAEEALARLRPSGKPAPVPLRIAIISSLAADLTPLLVARVGRELPEVKLHIIEAGTREIEHKLQRREADMAVYLAGSADNTGPPLATEQLFVLAPADDARNRTPLRLAELSTLRLVLPARSNPLREFMEDVARSRGLRLDVVLEVDGARPRRNAVLNGIGATIIGTLAAAAERAEKDLAVREIVSPQLFRPIFAGARRDLDSALRNRMNALVRGALLDLGLSPAKG